MRVSILILHSAKNNNNDIRALAFLPNERLCVVSNTVQLRRSDGHLLAEPPEPIIGIFAVAISKDGERVVAGAIDGFAIWNLMQGRVVRHSMGRVRTIDISSDSKWVATGSDDYTADMWDISTGQRRPGLETLRHEYNVIAVKFCPCGERIATATLFGFVQIFATTSGQKLLTIPTVINSTVSVPNATLVWSTLLPYIFAVSQGYLKCFDSDDDASLVFEWPMHGVSHPSSIALSPNSKIIAYSVNDTVLLQDTATCQQIGDVLKYDGNVSCITFSPGGDRLAVGVDTKFIVQDLRKLPLDTSHFVDVSTSACVVLLDLTIRH